MFVLTDTYSARTTATTPSPSSPSDNHATGNIHNTGGDSATPKNDVDDLRRQVEENGANIAALVAAAKHQDDTIEKMQAIHNKTQATVDRLIVQISALVALSSRDPKPANEAESHTLTISSNKNKRNPTDSPPSSPSENHQTRKRINDSTTPMERLFQSAFGYGASTFMDTVLDDASNSQNNPE